MEPDKQNGAVKQGNVRDATRADIPELERLLCADQAAAGKLADVNVPRMRAAFERGIAKDGSMLVVAPGTRGRLNGFLLIRWIEVWFSSGAKRLDLHVCIDGSHRRSRSVVELRGFADWVRRSKPGKGGNGAKQQKCAAEAPSSPLEPVQAEGQAS